MKLINPVLFILIVILFSGCSLFNKENPRQKILFDFDWKFHLDDIENVSVLQGAAAAAQFGSQGANGAIVITLKNIAPQQPGLGITVNSGILFESPYILPNYQNSYAGGAVGDLMQYKYKFF